jgi:hypothetical protein
MIYTETVLESVTDYGMAQLALTNSFKNKNNQKTQAKKAQRQQFHATWHGVVFGVWDNVRQSKDAYFI